MFSQENETGFHAQCYAMQPWMSRGTRLRTLQAESFAWVVDRATLRTSYLFAGIEAWPAKKNDVGADKNSRPATLPMLLTKEQVAEIVHTGLNGVIDSFDYTLDPNGNGTAVTMPSGSEQYTLDPLNRMTAASYVDGSSETFV